MAGDSLQAYLFRHPEKSAPKKGEGTGIIRGRTFGESVEIKGPELHKRSRGKGGKGGGTVYRGGVVASPIGGSEGGGHQKGGRVMAPFEALLNASVELGGGSQ